MQGAGHACRMPVLLRFAGANLWRFPDLQEHERLSEREPPARALETASFMSGSEAWDYLSCRCHDRVMVINEFPALGQRIFIVSVFS